MNDKNHEFVKIIDAIDSAGYEVKSIAPERLSHGDGVFSEGDVIQVRIVPLPEAKQGPRHYHDAMDELSGKKD